MPTWDDDLKYAKPSRFKRSAVRTKFLSLVDEAKSKTFEEDYIDEVSKKAKEKPYVFELRASKLPFCTMLELYRTLTKQVQIMDYSFDFYTSIGTAVHETIQNSFPEAEATKPFIFGNWICENRDADNIRCDYKLEKSTTPSSLVCPKCKSRDIPGKLKYDELHFIHEGELGCHIDGMLRYEYSKKKADKVGKKHYYIPLEYKTTSQNNIDMPHLFLPIEKHIFQAFTYCMVMLAAGYDVPGFVICYFSRDKSKKGKGGRAKQTRKAFFIRVDKELMAEHVERMKKTIRSVRLAKKMLKLKSQKDIWPLMEKVVALRPCHNEAEYEDYMNHTFFGKERCEFACKEGCFGKNRPNVADKLVGLIIKENKAA